MLELHGQKRPQMVCVCVQGMWGMPPGNRNSPKHDAPQISPATPWPDVEVVDMLQPRIARGVVNESATCGGIRGFSRDLRGLWFRMTFASKLAPNRANAGPTRPNLFDSKPTLAGHGPNGPNSVSPASGSTRAKIEQKRAKLADIVQIWMMPGRSWRTSGQIPSKSSKFGRAQIGRRGPNRPTSPPNKD